MPLTPGQRRLYRGEYNYMQQEWQPDGSCIVTITGGSHPDGRRMHISDLWGPAETVLSEDALPPGPPPHIRQRLAEAAGPGP